MIRITIDLTPTLQSQAGLGRYAAELTRALYLTLPADERLELFYIDSQRRPPPASLSALSACCLPLAAKPWRFWVLLAQFLRLSQDRLLGRPDVFLATDHVLPYLTGSRAIFTLGDVTFISHPQTHSCLNRTYLRLMMPHFIRQADAVLAISHSTLREAAMVYPALHNKGYVVYPAVGRQFCQVTEPSLLEAVRRCYHLPDCFLLYVGTIEPRKNLLILFEAFKQAQDIIPDVKLVLAGKKGWLYTDIFAVVQSLGLREQVIFTNFVPDEHLPALYTLAQGFIYPSLYEGFGLPILEAMACGTPVLCSDTSSLPEVTGSAAILLPPTDVRAWVEAMTQVTQNATLQADLRQRGLRQAARFTWEATARQTREIYREIYVFRS
ncbi:MAG: glycosyltransferase family 4 protein [Anaerolineae bacterium]|nr:glycosyltransferase family 4 protein [Anaerolineae bacterium]